MGSGRWSPDAWTDYSKVKSFATRSVDDVINKSGADPEFLPTAFKNGLRESRDSVDNPKSTAVIVAGDVTGSMGRLAGQLIKDGLSKFATDLYARKPVTDPHLMGMAIGDANSDRVPLQATQFEADIRVIQQFEKLYVEGNGGSNDSESYHLPWLCAAMMTQTDCFDKRGEKGVLFTYGDECVPTPLTKRQVADVLGIQIDSDLSAEAILTMVSRTYDCYHLIIEQGNFAKRHRAECVNSWTDLMGQHAIPVADSTMLAEVMTSILEVSRKGLDTATVAKSWSGDTAVVVARAIDGLVPSAGTSHSGLVAL